MSSRKIFTVCCAIWSMYLAIKQVYLAVNFVNCGGGGVESAEEVIGAPPDEVPDVIILAGGTKLVFILDHTPTQHRHRKRHRKMELNVVPGVVVAANQPSFDVRQFGPVVQPGILPPRYAIVFWQLSSCINIM